MLSNIVILIILSFSLNIYTTKPSIFKEYVYLNNLVTSENDTINKTYYPNQKLESCIIKYEHGDTTTYHLSFYENGVIKEKGYHGNVSNKDVNTKMNLGTWYNYDQNGILLTATTYNNLVFRKATIQVKRYYSNGRISAIEWYNNHVLYETDIKEIGVWTFYNKMGKLTKRIKKPLNNI
jgi:hypothetical protein